MATLHVLQHVPFEGPAAIGDWAIKQGHQVVTTHLYRGESLPSLDDFDWLLVMGGPMGVYDTNKLPWLAPEIEFVGNVARAGKPVLGICLGAQLLARALGADVYRNEEKEIGWLDVQRTPAAAESPFTQAWPDSFTVFQWHGDTFSLPEGATHLAQSPACAHQAFQWGERAVALQFHLESTAQSVDDLVAECAADLTPGKYVHSAEAIRGVDSSVIADAHELLWPLLETLCQ